MNNKGQALIEFVLILPIFLFLLLAVYDFGNIYMNKNKLESDSFDIINLYKDGETLDIILDIYSDNNISINDSDKYKKITIEKKIKIYTPGLGRIFGNPYQIKVERYIPNA